MSIRRHGYLSRRRLADKGQVVILILIGSQNGHVTEQRSNQNIRSESGEPIRTSVVNRVCQSMTSEQ